MTTMPLQDENARHRAATDVGTSFLVEAGAGTGKTSVLVQRLLTIVRTGRGQLEQLAAITFTEKAAAELRERLHVELEAVLASRLSEDERRNVREARRQFDRAQISTVHAFCANLLRERPVEARVDPDFSVLDAFNANVVRHEVWREWLAREMDRSPDVLKQALRADISLAHLEALRDFLLEHRDGLAFVPTPVEARVEAFSRTFIRAVERLVECSPSCVNPADRAFMQISTLSALLSGVQDSAAWERLLLGEMPCSVKAGTKTNWRPTHALEEARRLFSELDDARTQARAAWTHNLTINLVTWLTGYLTAYEERKRERSCLDFVDLLLLTRDLLKRDLLVRRYFQRRFRFLLVDEFQDTDPLQAEIIFFLAEREPRAADWTAVTLQPGKLFLVGDPQQSIYRFRRADLMVYGQVRDAILRQGEVLALATNFRTRAPALTWINETFRREFAAVSTDQSAYRPLLEARVEHSGREVIVVPAPPPSDKPSRDERRQTEARAMAAFLARAIGEIGVDVWGGRTIEYRDVAVLCRTHQTLEAYEDALREAGIPHRVAGGRRYANRPEIEEMRALLRAIERPSDTAALVAALRSSLFGCSDEELALFVSEGGRFNYTQPQPALENDTLAQRFAAMFAVLHALHERRTHLSPAALLTELYTRTHLLPLFALHPQGSQRVVNVLKLIETARALAGQGMTTISALNRFLEFQESEGGEGDGAFLEEQASAVRLFTIHQAKGLEFPVVILADAAYSQRHTSRPGILERVGGKLEIRIGPRDLTCRTLGWQNAEEQEQARETAEERRLWYVAATRVRDHLVIPVVLPPEGATRKVEHWAVTEELAGYLAAAEQEESGPSEANSGAARVWIHRLPPQVFAPTTSSRATFSFASQVEYDDAAARDYRAWEKARRAMLAAGGQTNFISTVTALTATMGRKDALVEAPAPPYTNDRQTSLRLGRAVHAALQHASAHGGLSSARAHLSKGIRPREQAEVARLVANALASPVMERAWQAEERFAEVPFSLHLHARLIEGVVDFAFLEDGAWVVVDFKTDRVAGEAVSARATAYHAQLYLYALALERVTRYPVKELILLFLHPQQAVTLSWSDDERRLAETLVTMTPGAREAAA
jgi:ATP-dependent exoDNAse (exonuclease V) beta subunit